MLVKEWEAVMELVEKPVHIQDAKIYNQKKTLTTKEIVVIKINKEEIIEILKTLEGIKRRLQEVIK